MSLRAVHLLLALCLASGLAGCASDAGAAKGNFELTPQRIGWYAGEEARFTLALTPTLLRDEPSFTLDRRFAIEEIQLTEKGVTFGGDYSTREPDDLELRLVRGNETADEFVLDATNHSVELVLRLPSDLRDSEYVLEMRIFQVGWIKSDTFRVDVR